MWGITMYHHTSSGWKMLKESEGVALVSLLCSVLFQDALLGPAAVWAELIYRTPMASQGLTRSGVTKLEQGLLYNGAWPACSDNQSSFSFTSFARNA